MFDTVIFDWDGTLADTRKAIVTSFHTALREIGSDVTGEYIERRIGIGASDTFREILKNKKGSVDETLVKQLVERKSEIQIQLANEVKLFPGASELLEFLQGKTKMGLASMNNSAVINRLLELNNLKVFFDVILTVEKVSRSKPDPEIFLKTARALESKPMNCVVFEDSIFGVKAAKAAGMHCIAVTTGVYRMEELEREKPDLVIKTLLDPKIHSFILR